MASAVSQPISSVTRPRPVTLSAVAREAGVTVTAVSALFKGAYYGSGTADARTTVGVGEAARRRIVEAARNLGFQPADPAWRLRLYPENGDICFLLPADVTEGLANPYYSRFANGALGRLHANGRHLAFAFYQPNCDYLAEPWRLPGPLREHQASAVLIAGAENPSLLATLAERAVPTIYLSRRPANDRALCLTPDYRGAAAKALHHLHSLGHRRIARAAGAYMAGQEHALREFDAGWRETWSELGLPGRPPPLVLGSTLRPAGPHSAMPELWSLLRSLSPRPTAIHFYDDHAALTCQRAALAEGMALPGALSMVGTNNQAGSASADVPLSTIDFPSEAIGAAAIDLLDAGFRHGEPPAPGTRVFPVTLVPRLSSAAPVIN